MIPAEFEYTAPETLAEAITALTDGGEVGVQWGDGGAAGRSHHSTVTLLARLRGLSIGQPRMRAA